MPNIPSFQQPIKYINGLQLNWIDDNRASVSPGQCMDSSNTVEMILNNTIEFNINKIGIGGWDFSFPTVANSSGGMINLYLIGSPYGLDLSIIGSNDAYTPYLPSDYNLFRKIGTIGFYKISETQRKINPFFRVGNSIERMHYENNNQSILNNGQSITFAEINLSRVVPPKSSDILLSVNYDPDASGNICSFVPYSSDGTAPRDFGFGALGLQMGMMLVPYDSDPPRIKYKVSGASDKLNLYVGGYKEFLL